MAQLPDLDPNAISTIAWWDVGVTIQKSDIIPILASFVEYDNGIDGVLALGGAMHISVNIRVRTDGLIIAYSDRATETASGTVRSYDGTSSTLTITDPLGRAYFYAADLNLAAINTTVGNTFWGRALDTLENAVTTAGKTAVTLASVNYYDFELPNVTTIYVFILKSPTNTGGFDEGFFTVPIGQGIVIHHAAIGMWSTQGSSSGFSSTTFRINATNLTTVSSSGANDGDARFAQYDAAAIAALLQPEGTANSVRHTNGSVNNFSGSPAGLVLWVEE